MTQHQRPGHSDEWFTPRAMLDAIGLTYDLDPASPGPNHWVPARQVFTKADDGLAQPWNGLVWLNPPFGGRNGQVPWLRRFFEHGRGICLVNALTSSGWFHEWAVRADAMLFPKGKTKFVRPDGTVQAQPPMGVVLLACGDEASNALMRSGLGFFVDNRRIAA